MKQLVSFTLLLPAFLTFSHVTLGASSNPSHTNSHHLSQHVALPSQPQLRAFVGKRYQVGIPMLLPRSLPPPLQVISKQETSSFSKDIPSFSELIASKSYNTQGKRSQRNLLFRRFRDKREANWSPLDGNTNGKLDHRKFRTESKIMKALIPHYEEHLGGNGYDPETTSLHENADNGKIDARPATTSPTLPDMSADIRELQYNSNKEPVSNHERSLELAISLKSKLLDSSNDIVKHSLHINHITPHSSTPREKNSYIGRISSLKPQSSDSQHTTGQFPKRNNNDIYDKDTTEVSSFNSNGDHHQASSSLQTLAQERQQQHALPQSMLRVTVNGYDNSRRSKRKSGFGIPQGSDSTRSSSSTTPSDWWSQDVWGGSDSSNDDTSIWFQKPAGQADSSTTSSKDNTGSTGTDWWQQGSASSGSTGQSSSGASSSSSWGGSGGSSSSSSSGSDSGLGSFSYSLWQSVAANQGSPSSSSTGSTGSFGTGSSSGFDMGGSNNNSGGFSGSGFGMSQQGGQASSFGQSQGGGSATGFVQGGTSSGMDGMFSFGMSGFGSNNGGASSGTSSSTGGGSSTSGGFDFGSSQQGFGSSGGGGDGGGMLGSNNNLNSNMMNNDNSMFNFGGSSGMSGFSMAGFGSGGGGGGGGGGSSSTNMGSGGGGGGSDMSMGMNPGFGSSQGGTGDNAAGMFYTFAQAQNAPGANTGAGFGSPQGMGAGAGTASGSSSSATNGGSTFPLQGADAGSMGASGLWGSQTGDGSGSVGSMLSMGQGGGGFQFGNGLSENNNAWQFSGMTNPGFSSPGFGSSQNTGSGGQGGGTGAGFGSAQSSGGGGMFSASGSPGFGMSQGGMGSGGFGSGQGEGFSMTNGMGGGSTGGGVSMGVASGMTSNGGSMGGVTSNQGGSLSQALVDLTRELGGVSKLLDEEVITGEQNGNSGSASSPYSNPQYLGNSIMNTPFEGGSPSNGIPSGSNSGPSGSSGNPFTGGSAPISGFTIGGGGQVSAPNSGAQFNFGSGDSSGGSPGTTGGANTGTPPASGAAGFSGAGAPSNQPQQQNGAGGGPSNGSPFSSAMGGGGNSPSGGGGGGASMGSPFSSAMSGESPFGSSNMSPFSFGANSSPFGQYSSSDNNPFTGSSNPFSGGGADSTFNPFSSSLSGTQTDTSDSTISSQFGSSQMSQFMPMFSTNTDGSQSGSNQQSGGLFQIFNFNPQTNSGDASQSGNQFFGNSGSPMFSNSPTDSVEDPFASMFPMFQTGRQRASVDNMALSKFVRALQSVNYISNNSNTGLNSTSANDADNNGGLQKHREVEKLPVSIFRSVPSSQSNFPLFRLIDEGFVFDVVKQYCTDLLKNNKEWGRSYQQLLHFKEKIKLFEHNRVTPKQNTSSLNSKLNLSSVYGKNKQQQQNFSMLSLCFKLNVTR